MPGERIRPTRGGCAAARRAGRIWRDRQRDSLPGGRAESRQGREDQRQGRVAGEFPQDGCDEPGLVVIQWRKTLLLMWSPQGVRGGEGWPGPRAGSRPRSEARAVPGHEVRRPSCHALAAGPRSRDPRGETHGSGGGSARRGTGAGRGMASGDRQLGSASKTKVPRWEGPESTCCVR